MNYKQMGWKVAIARMASYIFLIAISSCLFVSLADIYFVITERNSFTLLVAAVFYYLLFMVGMAIFAVYNLWRFPKILTSDKGIDLKVFFYTMHIDWKDVVRVEKRNNRLLIFLGRKGLLLNRLYGSFHARVWDQPVVLFDSSEEMVNRLEEDIKAHLARIG